MIIDFFPVIITFKSQWWREHLKEDNKIPVEQNFFTIQEKFEQNLWSMEEVDA